ncbi:PIN-like domain-containing protein [Paenibacillus amylolyticus]|uniref:PIN-like domain-containing protein n=1 Tax=Paenibacillus amylolyticus TaxID=1451 RepID=UPI00249CB480|nr:PIN-like domain-containing protein [Paenibacillus amylolyticus]WFA86499.1 PIN-like domain-containing protein [Paenibacillus amylolyticus]
MKEIIDKFFFKPKSIEEVIHTANVVFDTNAMLSAYQWKNVAFRKVLGALSKLSDANRLKIPPQVFKEFIHQRPLKITEAIEKIEFLQGSIQTPQTLKSVLPLIGLIDKENTYLESEKSYASSRDKYKEDLKKLTIDLKKLFNDDIVLDSLKPFFEKIDFDTNPEKEKELIKCAEERAKAKMPPLTGGDAGKSENKYGDFFVWNYILSLKNDVIFVTTDSKEDWFHKAGAGKGKNPVSPRRELIEEFYVVSEGKTICIVSLQDFMQKYDPNLAQEVVDSLPEFQNDYYRYTLECAALRDIKTDQIFDYSLKLGVKLFDFVVFRHPNFSSTEIISSGEPFEIEIAVIEPLGSDYIHSLFNKNTLFNVLYVTT